MLDFELTATLSVPYLKRRLQLHVSMWPKADTFLFLTYSLDALL